MECYPQVVPKNQARKRVIDRSNWKSTKAKLDRDPEKKSLLKEGQTEERRKIEYKSSKGTPAIERFRQTNINEMRNNQKPLRDNFGYDHYQTYMAKGSKAKDPSKKKDSSGSSGGSKGSMISDKECGTDDTCSKVSCAFKKIIKNEFAGLGCLLMVLFCLLGVAFMLCFNCLPAIFTTSAYLTGTKSTTPKRLLPGLERLNQDRGDLNRIQDIVGLKSDDRKDGDESGIGGYGQREASNGVFQDYSMLSKDLAGLQLDRLNRESNNDNIKDFYKKLIQTDAQIRKLKKLDPYGNINYGPFTNSYMDDIKRFRRSLKSINLNEQSERSDKGNKEEIFENKIKETTQKRTKENRKYRADDVQNDPKYDEQDLSKFNIFYPPVPFVSKNIKNSDPDSSYKQPERKKRADINESPGIVIEKKRIIVQYAKPFERKSKCSHAPKNELHEKHLKHPFYKNTQRFDEMLDRLLDKSFPELMSDSVKNLLVKKQHECKHKKTQAIKNIKDFDNPKAETSSIASRQYPKDLKASMKEISPANALKEKTEFEFKYNAKPEAEAVKSENDKLRAEAESLQKTVDSTRLHPDITQLGVNNGVNIFSQPKSDDKSLAFNISDKMLFLPVSQYDRGVSKKEGTYDVVMGITTIMNQSAKRSKVARTVHRRDHKKMADLKNDAQEQARELASELYDERNGDENFAKRDIQNSYNLENIVTSDAPSRFDVEETTLGLNKKIVPDSQDSSYFKYFEELPKRRLLQADEEEEETLGYEDVKEVLNDDSDSHDETERQIEKRETDYEIDDSESDDNEKENEANEVDDGSEGQIDPEFDDNSEIAEPVEGHAVKNNVYDDTLRKVNKRKSEQEKKQESDHNPPESNNEEMDKVATPTVPKSMQVFNPNWKGPMPLYPGELSPILKNTDENKMLSSSFFKNPIKTSDVEHYYGGFSAINDLEEYLNSKYSGKDLKPSEVAQAYSDYGVLESKKDGIKNEKIEAINKQPEAHRFKFAATGQDEIQPGRETNSEQGEGIKISLHPKNCKKPKEFTDISKDIKKTIKKNIKMTKPCPKLKSVKEPKHKRNLVSTNQEHETDPNVYVTTETDTFHEETTPKYDPAEFPRSEWELDKEGIVMNINSNFPCKDDSLTNMFKSIKKHIMFAPLDKLKQRSSKDSEPQVMYAAGNNLEQPLSRYPYSFGKQKRALLWLDNVQTVKEQTNVTTTSNMNSTFIDQISYVNNLTKHYLSDNSTIRSTENISNTTSSSSMEHDKKLKDVTLTENIFNRTTELPKKQKSNESNTISLSLMSNLSSTESFNKSATESVPTNPSLDNATCIPSELNSESTDTSTTLLTTNIENNTTQVFKAFEYLNSLAQWFSTLAKLSEELNYGNARVPNDTKHEIKNATTAPANENISDIVYQMYDSEAMVENIGHRSRVLLAIDENSTAEPTSSVVNSSDKMKSSSTPEIQNNVSITTASIPLLSTTEELKHESVNQTATLESNRTVVKRSVGQGISWSDMYDDEYGVKSDSELGLAKNTAEGLKVIEGWRDKVVGVVNNVVKKRERNSSGSRRARDVGDESPQPENKLEGSELKESTESTAAVPDTKAFFAALTANMKQVCKQAADSISQTKTIDIREDRQKGATTLMMQQLLRLMNEVVTYQVQQQTCLNLPPDLEAYLKWLTGPQDALGPNNGNYQMKVEPVDDNQLNSPGQKSDTSPQQVMELENPSSEKEDRTESRSECLGTLRTVEELIQQYDHMSEDDKVKMTGVREYLENQLNFLQKLEMSLNDVIKSPSQNNNYENRIRRKVKRHIGNRTKKNQKYKPKTKIQERKPVKLSKFKKKHMRAPSGKNAPQNATTGLVKVEIKSDVSHIQKIKNKITEKITPKENKPLKHGAAKSLKGHEKRNLKDVYYKALADAKKYTTKTRYVQENDLAEKRNILRHTG